MCVFACDSINDLVLCHTRPAFVALSEDDILRTSKLMPVWKLSAQESFTPLNEIFVSDSVMFYNSFVFFVVGAMQEQS